MSYTITLKMPVNKKTLKDDMRFREEIERFATSHGCTVSPDYKKLSHNIANYYVFNSESFDCIHELSTSFLNTDATDLIHKI